MINCKSTSRPAIISFRMVFFNIISKFIPIKEKNRIFISFRDLFCILFIEAWIDALEENSSFEFDGGFLSDKIRNYQRIVESLVIKRDPGSNIVEINPLTRDSPSISLVLDDILGEAHGGIPLWTKFLVDLRHFGEYLDENTQRNLFLELTSDIGSLSVGHEETGRLTAPPKKLFILDNEPGLDRQSEEDLNLIVAIDEVFKLFEFIGL